MLIDYTEMKEMNILEYINMMIESGRSEEDAYICADCLYNYEEDYYED